jgi:hypothetical protein
LCFVEEVSNHRKVSLSGAKRKVEEFAEEADSAEVAKGLIHADERPTTRARLEDHATAGEKTEVKGAASIVPP